LARLVWDGGEGVRIPEELGTPAPNQMRGMPHERLSELACRVCYDSLGRGRSSEDLHKHILDVKHLSVYEHAQVTLEVFDLNAEVFLNRPGIWVLCDGNKWRITLNPRVVLDWSQWSRADDGFAKVVHDILRHHMERLCPMICPPIPRETVTTAMIEQRSQIVPPKDDEEKWITLFLAGSRGFSHELVRHGNFTAISQRSTRYVDENGSPWVDHPLVQEFFDDPDVAGALRGELNSLVGDVKHYAQDLYARLSDELHKWLLARGVDKLTARKQARGAARGYLGNALYTELIFSGSVGQWKRMLKMRCCDASDGEIRAVFVEVLKELKTSRYAADFAAFELAPSSDTVGESAMERSPSAASS
jgi:thymidylate synthase ThyX